MFYLNSILIDNESLFVYFDSNCNLMYFTLSGSVHNNLNYYNATMNAQCYKEVKNVSTKLSNNGNGLMLNLSELIAAAV